MHEEIIKVVLFCSLLINLISKTTGEITSFLPWFKIMMSCNLFLLISYNVQHVIYINIAYLQLSKLLIQK